jgi:hypothetical protein
LVQSVVFCTSLYVCKMSATNQNSPERPHPPQTVSSAAASHRREEVSLSQEQEGTPTISDTLIEHLSSGSRSEIEAVADAYYVYNRSSPTDSGSTYGMMMTESASGSSNVDDGTIDAAVVEEIIDGFVPSPLLSSSPQSHEFAARNASVEAQPVLATNMIPEVEPEVDIEEIHVRYDASHISTVSALTTTSANTMDAMDTKLPPTITPLIATEPRTTRYSPITAPPLMPHRQPMIPEYRGFSAGTATTSAAAMMMKHSHVSNDSAANETAASAEPMEYAMSPTLMQSGDLPDYKDQSRPRIPSGSPLTSRNASNNTGGGSNNTGSSNQSNSMPHFNSQRRSSGALDVDDEHIPVVDAVLVPAERLAAEEQAIQQLRYSTEYLTSSEGRNGNSSGNSSGASTLSTSRSSDNNASDGNNSSNHNAVLDNGESTSRSKSSENANLLNRPLSERRFWVTVIVAALLLNSFLVAGAVVGGFCAAGKCSGSSSDSSNVSNTGGLNQAPPLAGNVMAAPSISPSRGLSAVPTVILVTTTPPGASDIVPGTPTRSPQPEVFKGFSLSPTQSPQPIYFENAPAIETDAPGSFVMTVAPVIVGTSVASMVPSPAYVPNAGVALDPTNGLEPSGKDDIFVSLSPSVSPTVKPIANFTTNNSSTNENKGVSLAALIPVLVALEAMILVGLLIYYRRWKRQKALYFEHDSILAPETAKTLATDSSNGGTGTAGPHEGCNTSRSSNGSSTPALPTIAECESNDHDQYSV